MLKIKIKKISDNAVIPFYAKKGDAGMDVVAISKKITEDYIEYGTGLCFEIPEKHVCLIFPRSSISNKDLVMCNSVGVLDSGYRGELKLRFKKTGTKDYKIGEKIGQVLIISYPEIQFEEVEELEDSERGDGGFGSTGN